MESCITQDLKTALLNMIEKKRPLEIMEVFVTDFMPICAATPQTTVGAATTRMAGAAGKHMPTELSKWGPAVYYDEKGNKTDFSSPSMAFESLFHVSPSTGIECEVVAGEPKCIPKTMVMSFQSRGMIVRGDGDPPPVITHGLSEKDRIALHQAWNQKLKASGKHFTIYHPSSPQAKALDKETEKIETEKKTRTRAAKP
jgi:hypothetical protein